MPEVFTRELWVKDITDTAKVTKNANPKKNRELQRLRTVTISDEDTEIIVKNTPEALADFVLGNITVMFSTQQTTMADFGDNGNKISSEEYKLVQTEKEAEKELDVYEEPDDQ